MPPKVPECLLLGVLWHFLWLDFLWKCSDNSTVSLSNPLSVWLWEKLNGKVFSSDSSNIPGLNVWARAKITNRIWLFCLKGLSNGAHTAVSACTHWLSDWSSPAVKYPSLRKKRRLISLPCIFFLFAIIFRLNGRLTVCSHVIFTPAGRSRHVWLFNYFTVEYSWELVGKKGKLVW